MILSRLRRAFGLGEPPSPPSAPAGVRIYAIGDVHGRADLLDELAQAIARDLTAAPMEAIAVFLGDYVDRGPSSRAVLERLSAGDFPTPVTALRGNHEVMFLQGLEDAATLENWRRYGGLETLNSYGVDVSAVMRGSGYEAARDAFRSAVPDSHRRFLRSTRLSLALGDYFFCHAGVRPGVALELQEADDLLWIRDGFLKFEGSFGKVVVHGHTPVGKPDVRANRINLDTGAFATSALTCLALEGTARRFLTAGGNRRTAAGQFVDGVA